MSRNVYLHKFSRIIFQIILYCGINTKFFLAIVHPWFGDYTTGQLEKLLEAFDIPFCQLHVSLTWLFFWSFIEELSGEMSIEHSNFSALTTLRSQIMNFYFYLYCLYPIVSRDSGKLTLNRYINAFYLSVFHFKGVC